MNQKLKQAKQQLKQFEARIDALSLRERGILFLVILGVLFWIAANVVFSSLRLEQQRLERDVRARLNELQAMSAQSETIRAKLAQDPEALAQARVAELKQKLVEEEASVAHVVRGLVSPREMPRLVQQMLAKNKALQVIKMENLPAQALDELQKTATPAPATQSATAANSTARVYRHGMRIELRGQYVDIVRYLRALEAMPSKVFWGEVRFESETYPVSRVTLVIYTISLNKAWLEV
jgi:MSHA biogenesis protein MshJ